MKKLPEIRRFGEPCLREKTRPVREFDKRVFDQIDGLWKVLRDKGNGAALAANQVGILRSIIVIDYRGERFELINPEIVESKGEQCEYEGCLSLPNYSGKVKRAETVRIRFQNRGREVIEIERSGDLAICFQHEIDHLHGILFIDRMTEKYLENDETKERILVGALRLLTGDASLPRDRVQA